MNQFDVTGKVAVVNGASRVIGEAIARGLAACGATIEQDDTILHSAKTVAWLSAAVATSRLGCGTRKAVKNFALFPDMRRQ